MHHFKRVCLHFKYYSFEIHWFKTLYRKYYNKVSALPTEPGLSPNMHSSALSWHYVTDLVVLGDQDAGPSRFERHFLHRPEHVCLHREGELQTQITDVVVQDPLQVLSILWINGWYILVAHWDTWKTHTLTIVWKVMITQYRKIYYT